MGEVLNDIITLFLCGILALYDFSESELFDTSGIEGFTVSCSQSAEGGRMMRVLGQVYLHSALSIKRTEMSVYGRCLNIQVVMTLSRRRYPSNDLDFHFEVPDGVNIVTFGKNEELIWSRYGNCTDNEPFVSPIEAIGEASFQQ